MCCYLLLVGILLVLGCDEQFFMLTTEVFLVVVLPMWCLIRAVLGTWSLVKNELGAMPRTVTIRGWERLRLTLRRPTVEHVAEPDNGGPEASSEDTDDCAAGMIV